MGIEVAIASAVIGTVGSLYYQDKASKASQEGAQAQRRQEALQAAISRRQQQKAFRQAQAQAIQAGENQGVAESSGVAGGVGSIGSQFRANISFLDQQTQLADFAGNMFDKAARFQNRAQLFAGAAQLGMIGYDTMAGQAAAAKAATPDPRVTDFNAMFKPAAPSISVYKRTF